ncbi:MAG TPA: ASKHA domain-containing protein, partial [Chitinivibrionales bacterium]|nr:ASKHA domain-containing protein [Chitinivibrionales bacterium]
MKNMHDAEALVRVTIFDGARKTVLARKGGSLLDILRKAGAPVVAACGGKGICRKCTVTVQGTGQRLACRYTVRRDLEVVVPPRAKALILESGKDLRAGRRKGSRPDNSRSRPKRSYGLAVDIGTTTVVAYLVDPAARASVGVESFVNPQSAFGHDVISRIHYCMEHKNGLGELRGCLIAKINESIGLLCSRTGIKCDDIRRAALVGNPTMLHLFLGINPVSIAHAPHKPVFTASQTITARLCGLRIDASGIVHVLPGVSGYVGADITAGIASTPLPDSREFSLYLDIGTNGEIAMGNRKRLWCCAAAAGPAFEGASLAYGMAGIEGALCSFHKGKYATIGGAALAGICGSGIVDITAWLLNKRKIDASGYMKARFVVERGARTATGRSIVVTPADIREIQLAKAAIQAGIGILLKTAGLRIDDMENLYLAGAFGAFMNVKNAAAIGLIPRELKGRVISLGNAAGTGARNAVLSSSFEARVERIAARARYVELSGREDF